MSAHPESHGHWDHKQISDLLYERDALRALLRDERIRIGLHSLPRKLDFMHERGMESLDDVHAWMSNVVASIDAALGEK